MAEVSSSSDHTFRRLQQSDAPSLLELWNRSASFDALTRDLMEQKIWQDPDFKNEGAWVAHRAGTIIGTILAVTRPSAEETSGVIKLLAVDPAWRRHGLGTRLLGLAERYLSAIGATTVKICESAPNYLCPGVDLRYSAGLQFLESRGYIRTTQACNMTAPLAGRSFCTEKEEAALAAAGWTIRRASRLDIGPLEELLASFGGSWRDEVFPSLQLQPPLVHLAIRGEELLGFAASEGNNTGTGWFGPMGTAPAVRGLGIGKVLLHHCLADLREMGFAEAIIPWVGPVGFYEKYAGATISRSFQRFEKELRP